MSPSAEQLLKYGPRRGWFERDGWMHYFMPRPDDAARMRLWSDVWGQDPWYPALNSPEWIEYVPKPEPIEKTIQGRKFIPICARCNGSRTIDRGPPAGDGPCPDCFRFF